MNSRLLTTALAALLALTACLRPDPAPRASETATPPPTTPVTGSPSPTATRTPGIPAVPTPASAALTATIEKFGAKKLAWRGCGDGGFECAKLPVPLDYDTPNGETIEISVIRLEARDRGNRIGSVVLNPGGPGGSGVEFARQARQLLPAGILQRFDVVSFDPRGVGESAPVDCLDDRQLDRLLAADPSPDDAAEKQRLITLAREQALECNVKSGKLLPHVGTVDTAKDLDVLREALGDAGLTYIGFSYGTLLGARYAQQFPGNIRALVLDGAVDPILTPREISVAQAVGFERALDSFLKDCVAQRCAFAGHGPIAKSFDELMARIERRPLDAASDASRKVGPSEALFGVAAALYSREYGWPVLRRALEEAYARSDGSTLLALFDNLVERENGRYSNSVEAQAAVSCVDGVYDRDPKAYDRDAAQFAKAAPRFGRALAYGPLACAFWPAPPTTRPAPARVEGAPPIVVVGTTGDPATPYEWSQSLAQQLPGVLVTYEGEGHTAYGYSRSSCVDRVVDAYLISLTVPRPGTRCR